MRKRHISQRAGTGHKPHDLSTSQGSLMFNDAKSTWSRKFQGPEEPTQKERKMISWLLIIYGRNL